MSIKLQLMLNNIYIQIYINILSMDVQKSIEIFLEKNNLFRTLQIYKNQSKRNPNYSQSKNNKLQNIHKVNLNNSNQSQVRQHFQGTKPQILRKMITNVKKNSEKYTKKIDTNTITKLPFFKKLMEKQNKEIDEKKSESDFQESRSRFQNPLEQSRQYENEWESQDDVGYDLYECPSTQVDKVCSQLSRMKNYEQKAVKVVKFPQEYYLNLQKSIQLKKNKWDKAVTRLPKDVRFPHDKEEQIYPLEDKEVAYDTYFLKVIYDREKTGFEQERQLKIVINEILAGRYQVVGVLGQAQFSRAIKVKDLEYKCEEKSQMKKNPYLCIKIIKNDKDYFDQSIDEIKLLRYIAANCNPDESHLLTLYDYFYHREHLMLVTELLKDNLYDAYRQKQKYFDLKTIRIFAKQILIALEKMHSLHIIHTDLKPENILIKSYSNKTVKVIDVGSSIFFHDKQFSSYIQTRSYRAPEVLLGCPYDDKIDIWSFGCIIAQLFTKEVLFYSESVVGLLAKIQGLRGPWPSWMIQAGKNVPNFFTKQMILFENVSEDAQGEVKGNKQSEHFKKKPHMVKFYAPKMTNMKARMNCDNPLFLDFLSKCLKIDPSVRFSAKQALNHQFITDEIID